MTSPLFDDLRPFVPACLGPTHLAELDRSIAKGADALEEYQTWRSARQLPIDNRTIVVWHFVAANAVSDVLRTIVIGWLDTLSGPAN